jgi:hypothetical protein
MLVTSGYVDRLTRRYIYINSTEIRPAQLSNARNSFFIVRFGLNACTFILWTFCGS